MFWTSQTQGFWLPQHFQISIYYLAPQKRTCLDPNLRAKQEHSYFSISRFDRNKNSSKVIQYNKDLRSERLENETSFRACFNPIETKNWYSKSKSFQIRVPIWTTSPTSSNRTSRRLGRSSTSPESQHVRVKRESVSLKLKTASTHLTPFSLTHTTGRVSTERRASKRRKLAEPDGKVLRETTTAFEICCQCQVWTYNRSLSVFEFWTKLSSLP